MIAVLGGVIGLFAAGGIWVIVAGLRGMPERPAKGGLPRDWTTTAVT